MARKRSIPVPAPDPSATRPVRCAVYVRKSTDEGLDREFSSLDAQREACEAYALSQRHDGWMVLPTEYADGGYSGSSMDRPAVQRLIEDVKAGLIDVVLIYKLDRISRSLLDFLSLAELLEDHHVALVSVTQQINTATSMGRLVVNVLMSFSQFEREIIGERTKDKMSAARRKGKFTGGGLPLGYDLDYGTSKLQINPTEATIVRELFHLYRMHQGLLPVAQEAERRGWRTKTWVTKAGTVHESAPLNRSNLHHLLTNVLYVGKVKYEGEIYEGEHDAIIDESLFAEVQAILKRNFRAHGVNHGNGHPDALLKGVLRCAQCGRAMIHSSTRKADGTRYRYYVCTTSQKEGVARCSTGTMAAADLEGAVTAQIKALVSRPEIVEQVIAEADDLRLQRMIELEADATELLAQLSECRKTHERLKEYLDSGDARLTTDGTREQCQRAALQIDEITKRIDDIEGKKTALTQRRVGPQDLRKALTAFDPVWEVLYPTERARIMRLLVETVDVHRKTGKVGVTFRPPGIIALHDELAADHQREGEIIYAH